MADVFRLRGEGGGSFIDPAGDAVDLGFGERFARIGRRHLARAEPLDQITFSCVFGNNRRPRISAFEHQPFEPEVQTALEFLFLAVAMKAMGFQQRLHIFFERQRSLRSLRPHGSSRHKPETRLSAKTLSIISSIMRIRITSIIIDILLDSRNAADGNWKAVGQFFSPTSQLTSRPLFSADFKFDDRSGREYFQEGFLRKKRLWRGRRTNDGVRMGTMPVPHRWVVGGPGGPRQFHLRLRGAT